MKFILKLFIRAFKGAIEFDEDVAKFIKKLPPVFCIRFNIKPKNINIDFEIKNGTIKLIHNKNKPKFDLIAEFKHEKAAKQVLFGKQSMAQSFSKHQLVLFGNINHAVNLVHALNIVENYLFPKFITNKILPDMQPKKHCKLRMYAYLVFGI